MVRRLARGAARNDLARSDAGRVCRRHEQVIEPNVRLPGGERPSGIRRMERAVDVRVARVETDLNLAPADAAAAQPDERAQPSRELARIEHVTRRQRIEVAD